MLESFLLALGLLAQAAGISPEPSPHDRIVELELTAEDLPLEDQGPARWVEHEVGFSGTLHIWTRSGIDLFLHIEDESGLMLGEDDNSGGGKTPYLELEVETGHRLYIAVAGAVPESIGPFALHLIASPEAAETRAAAERSLESLEVREDQGDLEGARQQLEEALAELEGAKGSQWSGVVAGAAREIAEAAHRMGAYAIHGAACQIVGDHYERTAPLDHPDRILARSELAHSLSHLGNLAEARVLQEAVFEARERTLPEDHPSLIAARVKLAHTMFKQRDLCGARSLQEEVLHVRERTLSEDHPDLLAARRSLALTMFEQGDLQEARELQQAVLEAYERIRPEDHRDLLGARTNLAITIREQGDLKRSHLLFLAVFRGYERTLPDDHPDLLRARANLAITMYDGGDLAGARVLQEEVLEARGRTLPEDHPDLLDARENLALTMWKQGDWAGARLIQEAVLEGYERAFPADHPNLLDARENLALTMWKQGDWAAARLLQEAVLEGCERAFPADHPDLLDARVNLALIILEQGDLASARLLQKEVLKARERTLPENHPELLGARTNLALTIWKQGDWAGARLLHERVLEARERTLPEDHPELLKARTNLALTMRGQGDLDGARLLQEAVLEGYERAFPADHPDLLGARVNLALTMGEQGDLDGARSLQEEVLEARERTLPENHPELLKARTNLSLTMWEQGDWAGARLLQEAVLEGYERAFPADHPDLLDARGRLAFTMNWQGDLDGARLLQEAVLEGYERTLPNGHPALLRARLSLSFTLLLNRELAGARALQDAVLEDYTHILPEGHPELSRTRMILSYTLLLQGDPAGARALQTAVLDGYERTLDEGHPDLLGARFKLAVTLAVLGDQAGARTQAEAALEGYESCLPDDAPMMRMARLLHIALKYGENPARSREHLDAALDGGERTLPEDHPAAFMERFLLAGAMWEQGEYAGAQLLLKGILEDPSPWLPDISLLLARSMLGDVMLGMGDVSGARAIQETVLEGLGSAGFEDLPASHGVSLSLAETLALQGDVARARLIQEALLESYERALPQDHLFLIYLRGVLALTMYSQGDLAGARALQESVVEAHERTLPEDHLSLLWARLSLASTLTYQGELESARALLEEVVEVSEQLWPEGHPILLFGYTELALVLLGHREVIEARALQERVLEGYERNLPEGHPHVLQAVSYLGFTLYQQGELDRAHALGRELARRTLDQLVRASSELSVREAQAAAWFASLWHSYARLLMAPEGSADSERLGLELVETMRVVAGSEFGVGVDAAPDIAVLQARLASVRGRIGDLLVSSPTGHESTVSISEEISALSAERDSLERQLRSRLAERGAFTGTIRGPEVSRGLPSNAVAIGFFRTPAWERDPIWGDVVYRGEILAAHVVSPDGSVVEVELGLAETLEDLAENWRRALGTAESEGPSHSADRGGVGIREGGEPDETALGRALRERLLDPLLAPWDGSTSTVFVCPADLVHALPLEALPLEGGVVGDRLRIVNEVSMRRFVAPLDALPQDEEPELLAIGGVDFGAEAVAPAGFRSVPSARRRVWILGDGPPGTFQSLPGSETEVADVGALFARRFGRGPSLLQGSTATKAAFHRLAPGKRYVHIATHGWFEELNLPEPRKAGTLWAPLPANQVVASFAPLGLCGLAFAGANGGHDRVGRASGILTAEELAGMDLSACELAVLSACESNVGLRSAGLGIQSLQSALHTAGVRTAVTSLWKVNDQATRVLMEHFYTNLWVDGMTKADALWEAKRTLRRAGHPKRHWAAWVLSGDPN